MAAPVMYKPMSDLNIRTDEKNEDTKSPDWLNQGNGDTLLIIIGNKSYLLIRRIFSESFFSL